MPDNLPLYEKFIVTRCDLRHREGEKHFGCRYFVLDLDHDPFAGAAIIAYSLACQEKYPALAESLRKESLGEKQPIISFRSAQGLALGTDGASP